MDVIPRFKAYSPEKAIEAMDKAGVATSFLSVTTPGIWFGNIDDTRRVARELNEDAAWQADQMAAFDAVARNYCVAG